MREQVSVFISKKEGRIFIRQDWKEVWEAPVTFRDPDRPLGTHVYTAVDAAPDGSSMRWTAISMPPEAQSAEAPQQRAPRTSRPIGSSPVAAAPETAAGALDRIELPEGARERIAELLWTGGSLIVSDNPRSDEMSEIHRLHRPDPLSGPDRGASAELRRQPLVAQARLGYALATFLRDGD